MPYHAMPCHSECGEDPAAYGHWCTFIDLYHAMGVLPSTQPVAALGSSFILSSFDVACTCCVPYARREAAESVFGVGMNIVGFVTP